MAGERRGEEEVGQHAATKSTVERVRGSWPLPPPSPPHLPLMVGAVATRAARHTGSLAHLSLAHPGTSQNIINFFSIHIMKAAL